MDRPFDTAAIWMRRGWRDYARQNGAKTKDIKYIEKQALMATAKGEAIWRDPYGAWQFFFDYEPRDH